MGGKSKPQQLTDSILGQHLALSVAAHLARTQLVPEPLAVYDSEHLNDMIDMVARALAKVAPLYVRDASSAQPRELSAAELEGAVIDRAATLLTLKDGRNFSSVSIKRADLRQAVAVLKAVGIEELAPGRKREQPPRTEARDRAAELRARVDEIEALLRPPLLSDQVECANRLIVRTARQAPDGRIANLAMRLMNVVQESKGNEELPGGVQVALARLRTAVEEAGGTRA
ncbi:MAG TPA: hypothetical protein VFT23_12755 [Burkholderiales bacterium]|nr:hypothetical protein [Burkholderiales bacterium]